jgi:hypothetical protein
MAECLPQASLPEIESCLDRTQADVMAAISCEPFAPLFLQNG